MVQVSFATIFQKIYFTSTSHCYLSAYPNATLWHLWSRGPPHLPTYPTQLWVSQLHSWSQNLWNSILSWTWRWRSGLPYLWLHQKNIPPEQHLNTMWTVNMVTTVLFHLGTRERRGPLVTTWRVRWRVWRRWRVLEAKMIVYSKVCLWFYTFSNLTTHFYRNQKSQIFPYH